jgi:hypothetical protein
MQVKDVADLRQAAFKMRKCLCWGRLDIRCWRRRRSKLGEEGIEFWRGFRLVFPVPVMGCVVRLVYGCSFGVQGSYGERHGDRGLGDDGCTQYRNSVLLAKEAGFDGIELLSQG